MHLKHFLLAAALALVAKLAHGQAIVGAGIAQPTGFDLPVVTESSSAFTPNYAAHAAHGSVYYNVVPGSGVQGPTNRIWTGSRVHTTITVPVEHVGGGTRHIKLRALRYAGCELWFRMEDGATCYEARNGRLVVQFHAADNPGLEGGRYRGMFELDAIGWHTAFRARFAVGVDIVIGTRAEVTRHQPYQSPNYAQLANMRSVYFVVQPQTSATGPDRAVWWGHIGPHSQIAVNARHSGTGFPAVVRLRAQRSSNCWWHHMNDAVNCTTGGNAGTLKVWYDAADNAHLPRGHYFGSVRIAAHGFFNYFNQAIQLDVNIQN